MSEDRYFPLVDVSGGPRERGLQHGRQAAGRVARSVALYRRELERRGVDPARQDQLARGFVPVIAAFDAGYVEEMQGIAEGAGVTLESVVTVNCRTEMMFGLKQAPEAHAGMKDGCTGVVVMPHASASGRLLHAHNWDWREEAADSSIVLRVRGAQHPDIVTLVEAGGLARHGFNAAGLALTANFLACDADFRHSGIPLGILRRKALEKANLAQAIKVFAESKRACSNNIMLSHADGDCIDLECTPDEAFWLQAEGGLLPHSNHFLSIPARCRIVDTYFPRAADTLYRWSRVRDRLAPKAGSIGYEDLVEALSDRFGFPDSVLRSPKPAVFDAISATVSMTIIDAKLGKMWLARKPYERIDFAEYSVHADTAARPVPRLAA